MTTVKQEFERKITIKPKGNQIEIRWYLIGEKGAVDFWIYSSSDSPYDKGNIRAGGVEGHFKKPRYDDQTPIKDCTILGCDCYPDGTSLYAMETVFPQFMISGEDAIWYYLERTYKDWFLNWPQNETI